MKKHKLLLLLTVISLTINLCIHAETIITDGLVSYWSLDRDSINDGVVKDVWGENDATIVGNPKIKGGVVNQGIELDGKDDYINLTNLGDFGNQLAASTFEVWVKTSHNNDWTTVFKVIDPIRLDCYIVWGLDINRTIRNREQPNHFEPPERKNIDIWTSLPYKEDSMLIYFGRKSGINGCRGL